MEIKLDDGKCTIDISDYYEDVTITSNDPILFNLLSMLQKESIWINSIESGHFGLSIIVSELRYNQILLIEQILGDITINSCQDIQCMPFLVIPVSCKYTEDRFELYKEYF